MNYETRLDMPASSATTPLPHDEAQDFAPARKKRLLVAIAIAAVLGVIAVIMLSSGEETTAFAPGEEQTAPRVSVLAPGAATIEGIINATGTIAPRREMPVGVVGEGGRLISVQVEPGDWVRAGQVLAVIDRSVQNQQAASQSAQISVAQADADLAQANLDRALQLVERGFISKADIDRLTATRDAAVARVQVARAQLAERQARNAQLNIVAPAAGLVLARNVEPGQVVGGGSGVLFSIARGGEMEVMARVGESELGVIPVGAMGRVTPVGTDKVFTCEIWQKLPVIDVDTRQGTARCAMAYDPALRPGGFASVELASGTVVAPRLPESAILSDDRGSYVFIVGENNKVVRRPITLGQISDAGIVVAAGLDGSEKVVLRAGGFLTEGETVRPVVEGASDNAAAPAPSAG